MRLIDDWRGAGRKRSVQVSGFGAIAGALASGIAASGMIVPWLALVPVWAVFAGGSIICALTVLAVITVQKHGADKWIRKAGGPLSSRKVPW